MIVSSPCFGPTGGGHGIEYRLYDANKKYKLLQNVYFVFSDRVIEPEMDCGAFAVGNKKRKHGKIFLYLKKFKPQIYRLWSLKRGYKAFASYLKHVGEHYKFSNKDIYLFQDVKSAYTFSTVFSYTNCALIYHMQGSMYHEWSASLGIKSEQVHVFFNRVFEKAVLNMRFLCFPSVGTEECLVETEPAMCKIIATKEKRYLYNGISCSDIKKSAINSWIKGIRESADYIFSTVATLNMAKGVERIPRYLGKLKKAGVNFKWILIGNGVKAEEVQRQITQYNLADNTIWKREYMDHGEVLEILSISDFYILFHRQSIFDLSTLEAMHYGAIPILTRVGGNKEIIVEENGVFVDDFENIKEIVRLLNNDTIDLLKEKNKKIQAQLFDDNAMLYRYVKLVNELSIKG